MEYLDRPLVVWYSKIYLFIYLFIYYILAKSLKNVQKFILDEDEGFKFAPNFTWIHWNSSCMMSSISMSTLYPDSWSNRHVPSTFSPKSDECMSCAKTMVFFVLSFGLHFGILSSLFWVKRPVSQSLIVHFLRRRETHLAGLTAKQIDHHFIGAHHDRSVWDLSD